MADLKRLNLLVLSCLSIVAIVIFVGCAASKDSPDLAGHTTIFSPEATSVAPLVAAEAIEAVNGGGMLGHWGGVKLYHLVCSCSAKKPELTGQHKCPHHLLREMACLRVGQQRTGRKVLMLPILREACLEFGRQLPLCYASAGSSRRSSPGCGRGG